MMRKALLVFSLLLSVAAASANPPETTEALDIGSRLELFVDEYLIDRLEGPGSNSRSRFQPRWPSATTSPGRITSPSIAP